MSDPVTEWAADVLSELSESPLPGARYAYDVVQRRLPRLFALAAPGAAPAEALDVDRLAEAWGNVMDGRRIGSGLSAARINADTTDAADWAAIAAEYDRLAAPAEPATEGEPRNG